MSRKVGLALALIVVAIVATSMSPSLSADDAAVEITVISLASWNGEVSAVTTPAGEIGGAATLAAYWQVERGANPNTLVLGTGNSFGASPPLSNLFGDEPAVRALNAMGIDADTLGHSNFDSGPGHLRRLLNMTDYSVVAANLANAQQDLPGVRPYRIFELAGVKVAVIGITDPQSPSLVFPGNFGGIEVGDPVIAALQARERAAAEGADVFVLTTELLVTDRETPGGPLLDLARRVNGFDVILGDGDMANVSTRVNGALVVAAQGRGLSYGRTTVKFDVAGGKVLSAEAGFVQPLASKVTPIASIEAMLDVYRSQLSARLSTIVATANAPVSAGDLCGQPQGRFCESLTGNVVTDAIRAWYGSDLALLNAGALRASITCPAIDNANDFCPVYQGGIAVITEGQIQAVLPFANVATTVTVSGIELKAMLENGVSLVQEASGRFPQVSGFCFWYDIGRGPGNRVLAAVRQGADGACDGEAISFGATVRYSLVTNDFIAAGGDGYEKPSAPATARERIDTVLSRYLQRQKTIAPRANGRINCFGSACPRLVSGTALPLPAAASTSGGSVRPPATGDGGLR